MDKVGFNLCPEGWIEFIQDADTVLIINNTDD